MKMLNVSRVKTDLCQIVRDMSEGSAEDVLAITLHGQVVAYIVSNRRVVAQDKVKLPEFGLPKLAR